MGHNATNEALLMRWAELCADPSWNDYFGKVELNGKGVIEVSPARNPHSFRQSELMILLASQLPDGKPLVECAVLTADGVRAPDVAWLSREFLERHGDEDVFLRAPDICIEVRSPSNTNEEMAYKTELFLAAGAHEVWIVSQDGVADFFDATGRIERSRFGVTLPPPAA
jgi:Uma2 family endonuclease